MAYDGMWLPPEQDPRMQDQHPTRGERECVLGYLEHYRRTVELKCAGLGVEELAAKAVPPSNISLLGLLRHLARVEHHWARRVIEGQVDLDRLFRDEDAGFDFPTNTEALVTEAWELWRGEVAHAREVVAGVEFDAIVTAYGDEIEVRDVLVHLVEEYARHCGHADLIREVLDGRTGL